MIEIFEHREKQIFMSYIAKRRREDNSNVTFISESKFFEIGVAKDLDMEDVEQENHTQKCLYVPIGNYYFVHDDHHEPIRITINEEGQPLALDSHPPSIGHFLRIQVEHGDFNYLKTFITTAMNYSDPPPTAKIQLYSSDSDGFWIRHKGIHVQTIDDVFIPKHIKDDILKRVDNFLGMEQKYIKRGRPYKTSFLLTGPPGGGKTSLVKAMAFKYKMPLYTLNVTRSLTDDSAIRLVSKIKSKCILLLEDVDAFFADRTSKDTSLTFSCLLNFLDGVNSNPNGTLVFLTANNPQFLDVALLRVGRIDTIYNFGSPKKQEIMSAFMSMTSTDTTDTTNTTDEFAKFYDAIKDAHLSMCSIVDYLFHHETDYMTYIKDLLQQQQIREAIINEKTMFI